MKPAYLANNTIYNKFGTDAEYHSTQDKGTSALPSAKFYGSMLIGPLSWLCAVAARGKCTDVVWANSSAWFSDVMENVGCHIHIEGLDHLRNSPDPCVIVANHMSTLETFMLPAIVRPMRPVTFVVKKSLVTMPFFGPVMRSRNPVVVERKNPREDLATVLKDGCDRLEKGVSVIVFPQSTRSLHFEEENFNSIGVKLARKANVPVVPLALKTDAWGQGRKIKELGRIRPDLPIRFKFAKHMPVEGNGRKQQEQICEFIGSTLAEWQKADGINS